MKQNLKEAVVFAAKRFQQSAFTSGAMSRLFLGLGNESVRETFVEELRLLGFEVIHGSMNALGIFPTEFLQHQGTHFNRKLFLLTGIDSLIEKFGDEIFRRLSFERRQFTRTATWSLVWIDKPEVAERLRKSTSGLWSLIHQFAFFLQEGAVEKISRPTYREKLESSLGAIPIPSEVSNTSLDDLLAQNNSPSIEFWGDLIRLRPWDALLSFELARQKKMECSQELLWMVQKISSELRIPSPLDKAVELDEVASQERSDQTWVRVPERTLAAADRLYTEGQADAALQSLGEVLEGHSGWLTKGAFLLADRPIRFRALLRRALGKISEAASDLENWEEITRASNLGSLIAAALEARALHIEELGDRTQSQRIRDEAESYRAVD